MGRIAADLPASLGRYTLRARLGKGGMAEVFLADLAAAGGVSKIVAVKRALPHLAADPDSIRMFLDEARLASRLSHPNVVSVFDVDESSGEYFLAMEYLPGESLKTILSRTRANRSEIPIEVVLRIITAICDGLHYAHELSEGDRPLQIVHRDVTPANIVVTYQGIVKLLDFGVARAAGRMQEETESGVVKGKIAYCSPEQFDGLTLDARSDIFSLGVVFHEMLTGRSLFKRDSAARSMRAILDEPIPHPSAVRPEVPPEMDALVHKALARNREERFQTARELREAVASLRSGAPVRLDEYVVELFGSRRALSRVEMASLPPVASGSDSGFRSASDWRVPEEGQDTACDPETASRSRQEPTADSPARSRDTTTALGDGGLAETRKTKLGASGSGPTQGSGRLGVLHPPDATMDAPKRILIVEDDRKLATLVGEYLESNEYTVTVEHRGDRAPTRILDEQPDLVVLDIMLPGKDGLAVCREVRSRFGGAILMLTARGEEVDEVVGLEVGADDYMAKPVRPRLLLARINTLLRRTSERSGTRVCAKATPDRVEVGALVVDANSRTVRVDGQPIEITTAEFDLLWLLAVHAGEVISRERIYSELRGIEYDGLDRSIDLRIARMRKKLGDHGKKPRIIKSVRGVGYILAVSR